MLNKKQPSNPRDEECKAEALEAQRQGTELIQNHLSRHLEQNPDSSYVTWIACLHPENADVTIDERFLVPNNAWWTVFEGAKANIPTATAVPVSEQQEQVPVQGANEEAPVPGSVGLQDPAQEGDLDGVPKQSVGLDLFVGCLLVLIAVIAVFLMEAMSLLIYWISVVFYRGSHALVRPLKFGCASAVSVILLVIYWCLAIIDDSLLLASVLTTELVAGSLFVLSSLFAGFRMGAQWHQYLRRTCHQLRWVFRSRSSYPNRHFNCCIVKHGDDKPEEKQERYQVVTIDEVRGKQDMMNGIKSKPRIDEKKPGTWVEPDSTWVHSSVAPSAPLEPAEPVIVLDETNVFVEAEKSKK